MFINMFRGQIMASTILVVGGFLTREFFKGLLFAGVISILIAHLFRGEITFEGFIRSCLFGGIVMLLINIFWLMF